MFFLNQVQGWQTIGINSSCFEVRHFDCLLPYQWGCLTFERKECLCSKYSTFAFKRIYALEVKVYPVLFEINGVPIYAHGFFLNLALITCLAWVGIESKRRRWPKGEAIPITLAAFVGGMTGARFSILFFHGWEAAPVTLNFFSYFDPRIGPGSIMGGLIGAYIAGFIASRVIGKSDCACDAFAPAMALAMAIGRIGCYLSGEDGLGKPTDLPWGVWNGSFVAHPTPLYEAAFSLLWLIILLRLRNHRWMQNGNLLKFGVGGYAIFRFFIEFFRNNRIVALGLTGQQFVCLIILFAIGLYYGYQLIWSGRQATIRNATNVSEVSK